MTSHLLKSIDRCEFTVNQYGGLRGDYKTELEYFAVVKWCPLSLGTRTVQVLKKWN